MGTERATDENHKIDGAIAETIALLDYYGFELNGHGSDVVTCWHEFYEDVWIRAAVLEALYRGRYKQVSVEKILLSWQRWGQVRPNFDEEFAALICAKIKVMPPSTETETEPIPNLPEALEEEPQPIVLSPNPFLKDAGSETYSKLQAIAAETLAATEVTEVTEQDKES